MSHRKDIYAFPSVQPRHVQYFLFLRASDPCIHVELQRSSEVDFSDGYFEAVGLLTPVCGDPVRPRTEI